MKKIIEKYSEKQDDQFKRIFFTFLFGYLPFAVLHIVLNLTGVLPVNFNDEEIYGVKGIVIILFFTPLLVLMMTFFVWLYFIFGNFVLRTIKKMFYE